MGKNASHHYDSNYKIKIKQINVNIFFETNKTRKKLVINYYFASLNYLFIFNLKLFLSLNMII